MILNRVIEYRGYSADCTPRALDDGTFGAQVVFTKIGFHPEAAYRNLPAFPTSSEAIAHAQQFAKDWLDRKA
jgi:hypothetical protein